MQPLHYSLNMVFTRYAINCLSEVAANEFYVLGNLSAFYLIRATMGLFGAFLFPAVNMLLAAWVPKKERSRLGTFVLGGGQVCVSI